MKNFSIKPLEKENLSELLTMLKEFAAYENKLAYLKCDETKLSNLFLENEYAKAFILKENEQIIGYLVFFYTISSFLGERGIYIEDIYIRENFRKKGYGRKVFEFIGKLCQKENIAMLSWVCLNDNAQGINFYEKLDATHLKNIRTYRLDGQNLAKLNDL
ncbi:GNAT family N-acetyltransferase [Campylobacter vulpis]|uniref:GNAT family N-acetyltransferase n=1 Tax=Campylobacter vulpis TaxID=1655500 RepID=UPI001BD1B6A7|nr:GNAT family N-acetyltransferase [Campylobacter vulpis]MBS4314046.1 GNAT family N-acetyltransferase [Campylobacter vulpis]